MGGVLNGEAVGSLSASASSCALLAFLDAHIHKNTVPQPRLGLYLSLLTTFTCLGVQLMLETAVMSTEAE